MMPNCAQRCNGELRSVLLRRADEKKCRAEFDYDKLVSLYKNTAMRAADEMTMIRQKSVNIEEAGVMKRQLSWLGPEKCLKIRSVRDTKPSDEMISPKHVTLMKHVSTAHVDESRQRKNRVPVKRKS